MDIEPTAARASEIRVENLHKAFNGHCVLRGIDLEIRQGEIVACDRVS